MERVQRYVLPTLLGWVGLWALLEMSRRGSMQQHVLPLVCNATGETPEEMILLSLPCTTGHAFTQFVINLPAGLIDDTGGMRDVPAWIAALVTVLMIPAATWLNDKLCDWLNEKLSHWLQSLK